MASEQYSISILKPGILKRDRFGNILDARSTVTLIQREDLNIIVDTGLGSEKEVILRALNDLKLSPDIINYIIITHDHMDHTGNNALFSNAQIILHRNEVGKYYDISNHRIISNDIELFPNIHVIETFGHTRGSITLLVHGRLAEHTGIFALTGDALPIMDNFLKWVPPGINISPELALKSMMRIIEVSDFIIPGHDKPFRIVDRSSSNRRSTYI